jgi:hypothetical protein
LAWLWDRKIEMTDNRFGGKENTPIPVAPAGSNFKAANRD